MSDVFSRNYQRGMIAFISSVFKPNKQPENSGDNIVAKKVKETDINTEKDLNPIVEENFVQESKTDAQQNIAMTDIDPIKVRKQRQRRK